MKALKVTRTFVYVATLPEDSYPGMTLEEAVQHEKNQPMEEVTEYALDDDRTTMTTEVEIVEVDES
jgi:hypothetical protein